jgi:uncharacterized protein
MVSARISPWTITTRLAAQTDPTGMIRDLDRAIIDEVQLAPDLLRSIKESIDNDRRPGRFLLTRIGQHFDAPENLRESRRPHGIVTLLPLSRAEIRGQRPAFLQNALAGQLTKSAEKNDRRRSHTGSANWRLS